MKKIVTTVYVPEVGDKVVSENRKTKKLEENTIDFVSSNDDGFVVYYRQSWMKPFDNMTLYECNMRWNENKNQWEDTIYVP